MSTWSRRDFLATLGLGLAEASLLSRWAHAADPNDCIRAAQARLYAALDGDARTGKPLVATVLVNLTYYGKFVPVDRNMYWGGRGGYAGYFRAFSHDKPAPLRRGFLRWKMLPTLGPPPLGATTQALFAAGGDRPVFLAVLGFADGPTAMRHVLQAVGDADATCVLPTETVNIDAFRDARLLGFAGHNPAFDVAITAPRPPQHPRTQTVATFAIGCCTGGTIPACAGTRVAPLLAGGAAVPLFSDSLMTGEAFSFQAMLAAIIDRLPLPRVVDRANDEYQRVLSKGGERHGRPFAPLRRLYASLG